MSTRQLCYIKFKFNRFQTDQTNFRFYLSHFSDRSFTTLQYQVYYT